MGLILFTLAVAVIVWFVNSYRARNSGTLKKLPNNRWHSLLRFGIVITGKNAVNKLLKYGDKYGSNSLLWMGPYPVFLTSDPESIKDIFTSKNCVDKPPELYGSLSIVCGSGLISEKEPLWSYHRKIINKAFSNKNILSFLPIFNDEINKFINEINESVDKGEELDMLVKLRVLTIKNATKSTLKRDIDLTKFKASSMAVHIEELLEYLVNAVLQPMLAHKWLRPIVQPTFFKSAEIGLQEFLKFIEESMHIARKNDKEDASYLADSFSVLDCCLNSAQPNELGDLEIRGLLIHFFLAAFETVSTTLFLALALLAMYPEHQDRVYEEVSNVLHDREGELTINQLDNLSFLDMIFNETMRAVPIVPLVFRQVANEDLKLSNGTVLKVNQVIAVDIYRLHRSKEIWGPDADTFNPDHFLPENVAAMHPYSFIPFTKGQRFCIGWKYATLFFKIALAKLVKTYKFSTDFKFENFKFENHITMKLAEQPNLRMEKR